MSLFGGYKIDKEMLKMLCPTSKASLKTQCLLISNGDIDKAERLYDFYAKDMPDMPDFDSPAPTWIDNTKNTMSSFLSFFDEHKDGIAQVYEVVRSIVGKKGVNLPDIAGSAADSVPTVPLPPINE